MAGVAKLLERSRENGPLRDAPLGFVVALMGALADATIDFMIHDPANADEALHGRVRSLLAGGRLSFLSLIND